MRICIYLSKSIINKSKAGVDWIVTWNHSHCHTTSATQTMPTSSDSIPLNWTNAVLSIFPPWMSKLSIIISKALSPRQVTLTSRQDDQELTKDKKFLFLFWMHVFDDNAKLNPLCPALYCTASRFPIIFETHHVYTSPTGCYVPRTSWIINQGISQFLW